MANGSTPALGWVSALVAVAAGCGSPTDLLEPKQWLGDESHFRTQGRLGGSSFDVTLAGDASRLWCERTYEVPRSPGAAPGRLVNVRVVAKLDSGERMDVELRNHDLQADPVPSEVSIVPRITAKPPQPSQTWLQWKWFGDDGALRFSQAAQLGSLRLERYTGTPGTDGLVIPSGDGSVGVVLRALWTEIDEVRLSFSAPCTLSAVEEIQ